MNQAQDNPILLQLVRKIDPQAALLRSWSLQGGISAQVTALEIKRADGSAEKWVVRQHGAGDLQHNPQIAADEFKLLKLLQSAGIRAPKPYSVDQSGEIFPTPYIVLEYVEGAPDFAPVHLDDFLCQSATTLAQIHQIDGATPELAFLPRHDLQQTEKLKSTPGSA